MQISILSNAPVHPCNGLASCRELEKLCANKAHADSVSGKPSILFT